MSMCLATPRMHGACQTSTASNTVGRAPTVVVVSALWGLPAVSRGGRACPIRPFLGGCFEMVNRVPDPGECRQEHDPSLRQLVSRPAFPANRDRNDQREFRSAYRRQCNAAARELCATTARTTKSCIGDFGGVPRLHSGRRIRQRAETCRHHARAAAREYRRVNVVFEPTNSTTLRLREASAVQCRSMGISPASP
jgi:hypothetical protein